MRKRFFITTPIYYINDVPHLGHAYTTVAADVAARFHRLSGREVFFLTGTDEHGQKVERAAAEQGLKPLELADGNVERFKALWRRLDISNDDFIRTTEERHLRAVGRFFEKLKERGDIYPGEYEDWYCVPCESFFTSMQLRQGCCPDCGRPVEKLKEKSYFFRMSRYQEALLRHMEENPDFIQPPSRRNEIVSFVKGGLRDLSVSRTSFRWGIPVPGDPEHVVYVWFDALVNYITAAGYAEEGDGERFREWWPADIHLIGKDILRFHSVYWPAFLLGAGLPLPSRIFAHGWWTVEGRKMSKSLQNAVDPHWLIDRYGVDAVRYFLLREVPFGGDGDFAHSQLIHRINSELANDLGNLLSRTLTMLKRYFQGIVPEPEREPGDVLDKEFGGECIKRAGPYERLMEGLHFQDALKLIWEIVAHANKYIDVRAPWSLEKRGERGPLSTVIYNCCEALRLVATLIYPFMPGAALKMSGQLGLEGEFRLFEAKEQEKRPGLLSLLRWGRLEPGTRAAPGPQLFPRIGDEMAERIKLEVESRVRGEGEEEVGLEDLSRLKLRVGLILSSEKVEGSDNLLRLKVDIGEETREVVAGIAGSYRPEELKGKKVILVTNLKPARFMGIESRGMVLAAEGEGRWVLASFEGEVKPGAVVR
ncbi:MAG: methionine--tRNA ligase [Nitrospinota bacterium]